MVSLKDVSIRCGVSVATVSKALNDKKDIGMATKEYIHRIAKEMNYFPDHSARALKTKHTYNIGVLYVGEAQNGMMHDYFTSVLYSFKQKFESCGYAITFINKHNGKNMSSYELCKYHGVEGIIIACIQHYDSDILEVINGDIPVVTIDGVFNNRTAVLSDNKEGMQELVTFLYEMGHKQIAFIHGNDSVITQSRVKSFYETMGKLGLAVPDKFVKQGSYHDPITTAKLTNELLATERQLTCIIFPDDFSSLGGIRTIRENGFRIPEDISVVGYDGIVLSQMLTPQLTTLQQDTKTIGTYAAEKLIMLIENPGNSKIERIIVKGKVLKGTSVKNLNTKQCFEMSTKNLICCS